MANTEMHGEVAPVELLDTVRRVTLDAVAEIIAAIPTPIAATAPHLAGDLEPLHIEVERALLLLRDG